QRRGGDRRRGDSGLPRLEADYLPAPEAARGGRRRQPRDRRQDSPAHFAAGGAGRDRELGRKPAGALGAPVRRRRRGSRGTKGTVTQKLGYLVRIERTFAASAEDVFDAWTNPEVMRRWLHPGVDWATPEAEVDLRVGGKVRVVMRRPDGTEVEARGEYVLIDRPQRLVMTWTFDDAPANEQLMELSFAESEGSTTVLLVNSGISTDERRDAQDWGWHGCLDQLERT